MNNSVSKLLQNLRLDAEHSILASFGHSEIAEVTREIFWRLEEIKFIINKQREDLETIHVFPELCDEHDVSSSILEFPYCAIWAHLSIIAQLVRCLKIYQYRRIQWINNMATELHDYKIKKPIPKEISRRFSSKEFLYSKDLLASMNKWHSAVYEEIFGKQVSVLPVIDIISSALRKSLITVVDLLPRNIDEYRGQSKSVDKRWQFTNMLYEHKQE